jgi:hypothetical protein
VYTEDAGSADAGEDGDAGSDDSGSDDTDAGAADAGEAPPFVNDTLCPFQERDRFSHSQIEGDKEILYT